MRKMKKLLTVMVCILMVASFVACSSEPKLDTSSDVAFKASLQEICKTLTPQEAKEFDDTIKGLVVLMTMAHKKPEQILAFFDGKTYKDVMNEVEALKAKLEKAKKK